MIGDNRTKLNSYLDGVTKKSIQDIRDTATTWSKKATTLNDIAYALGTTRTSGMAEGFGDRSEVARAASKAFTEASTKLTTHAKQLSHGSKSLRDAATALENAHSYKTKIDKRDAGATDPSKSEETNKSDDESQSKTYTDAIDTAYGDAILAMRKVHGDQPAPPPASGSDGGGPSYPGMPSGAGLPGGGSGGGLHPTGGGTGGPGSGTGPGGGKTGGTPGGGNYPGGPYPGGGYPGGGDGGGYLQGGDPPTVPTIPGVGAPGGSEPPITTGGGTSGVGAGGAGLAGAFGGLGSYGAGGSSAALRFTPGQTIGVSRSALGSAGVLGAEEEGAVAGGGRSLGAGGTVGRGGAAGAGGGRRGGAAGGRRTGAVAGGRGRGRGRDEDRDEAAADLWDDGAEWVDDEGMGPSVMR